MTRCPAVGTASRMLGEGRAGLMHGIIHPYCLTPPSRSPLQLTPWGLHVTHNALPAGTHVHVFDNERLLRTAAKFGLFDGRVVCCTEAIHGGLDETYL